ncbi:expressed unknown protein [Seminavis robusta]|uniref:Uncharacterized protein n=1 Tax=Seminavis robusta TaxID=568900 RepID=A0A9N8HCA4_9STRA|nr:expressed unknown protein [Seminavis robusta]|eukprot:Sro311_g114230.1 n/a (409) ;mRNA; r:19114-20340
MLNETNWEDFQYLIVRCNKKRDQCGGFADRLKAFPAVVRIASMTKRVLFYNWERPYPLEEFLLPGDRGINWSYPVWFRKQVEDWDLFIGSEYTQLNSYYADEIQESMKSRQTIIYLEHAFGGEGGEFTYDKQIREQQQTLSLDDVPYREAYHALWHANFKPTSPIQELLEQQLQESNLVPGQYTGFHYRSIFMMDEAEEDGINALKSNIFKGTNCALQFATQSGDDPVVLVAADSRTATTIAVRYVNKYTATARAVTRSVYAEKPLLHMDRGEDFLFGDNSKTNGSPADYFPAILDLYLLSFSRCMAYGRGGFGRMANLLSEGSSCYFDYMPDHDFDSNANGYNFSFKHCPMPPLTRPLHSTSPNKIPDRESAPISRPRTPTVSVWSLSARPRVGSKQRALRQLESHN